MATLTIIKWKDFKDYADVWFKKELDDTKKMIDDALEKVQLLKKEHNKMPLVALVPVLDMIEKHFWYSPEDMCHGSVSEACDDCVSAFMRDTHKYAEEKTIDIALDMYTRVVYNEPDDYVVVTSADYLLPDLYEQFIVSTLVYALNSAVAGMDLESAAVMLAYIKEHGQDLYYAESPYLDLVYRSTIAYVETMVIKEGFPGTDSNESDMIPPYYKAKIDEIYAEKNV